METKSRRPEDTPFKQQKLKAWQPILTPRWVIGTFTLVGLIFIPIGIILHLESQNVVEYSIQYDGIGVPSDATEIQGDCVLNTEADGNQFDVNKKGCRITFDIQEDMEAPIYLYYQLENFYQNHRRYVQSRSDQQLRGDQNAGTADCDPMKTVEGVTKYDSTAQNPISTDNVTYQLNPCGLIANSLFNDIIWVNSITEAGQATKYQNDNYGDKKVVNLVDQTGIAWQSDIDTKFKNIPTADQKSDNLYLWQNPNYRFIIPKEKGQAPEENVTAWTVDAPAAGVQDEHFIVWMRTAGLPNFRKLYGRIDTDLKKGTKLEFLVSSNFVVSTFDGKKYLVLSTTSWFGGRNPFLGIAYITVGSICLLLAVLFLAKHMMSPRKLGDTSYLVWKNTQ